MDCCCPAVRVSHAHAHAHDCTPRAATFSCSSAECGHHVTMQLKLVSPLTPMTGNRTTAERILGILRRLGNETALVDTAASDQFHSLRADRFVCIHAFRALVPLLAVQPGIRPVLVLGGTDANDIVDAKSGLLTVKGQILFGVIQKVCVVVGFSKPLCDAVKEVYRRGTDASRIDAVPVAPLPPVFQIAQGVDLRARLEVDVQQSLFPDIPPTSKIVLLVANLRPVKDVTFLLDSVDEAWGNGEKYTLVLVGSVLDAEYAEAVRNRVNQSAGAVKLYREQTRCVLLHMMKAADMVCSSCPSASTSLKPLHVSQLICFRCPVCCQVVNTSVNEGMCASLQEAMATGTCVTARRNPGNEYLMHLAFGREDAEQHVLFDTPGEFIGHVHRLLPHRLSTGDIPVKANEVDPERSLGDTTGATSSNHPNNSPVGSRTPSSEIAGDGSRGVDILAASFGAAHNVCDAIAATTAICRVETVKERLRKSGQERMAIVTAEEVEKWKRVFEQCLGN